jgi:hypothetical protein
MRSIILCLTLLAASLNVTAALAATAAAPVGVTVTPTTGLKTSEASGTVKFTVVLKSRPTADVTIALASGDISEGAVSPATLTFTASNWNIPQTVTVTGVDDALCDGSVAYTILTAAASSADRGYDKLDPANVAVTNTDNDCASTSKTTGTGTTPPAPGGIRISIKNAYDVALNFGPLGNGTRKGDDGVEGVLKRQGSEYVGIVDADVDSTQTMHGMVGSCGPARYQDSQKLRVTGHPTTGFNQLVQSVTFTQAAGTGRPTNASNEYLVLEFVPETMTRQQPGPRRPEAMLPDLVVSCHTLIDTLSGIAFLPLNDSRWTMEGGGYIIVLPSSGVLNYTDDTVAAGHGADLGPFKAKKSNWTIQVERLP